MKVIYNGKEIELEDKLEKGSLEQDMYTPLESDMEDTIEVTELSSLEDTNE